MNTTTITTNPPGLAKLKTFGWHFLVLFLLGFAPAWAQTDRIPVADGAFSNGASFAANGWSVSNGTNHQWIVNSAHALAAPFSGDAAYITNASPAYAYTPANNSNNFFWRDVTVPAGETAMTLTFNWNQQGENTWDIWQVFVAPTTINPVGNNTHPGSGNTAVPPPIAGATYVGNGSVLTGVQTFTGAIPASFAGTTFRLIFSWKNETGGTQPPAAIDNIRLTSAVPVAPVCNTTYFPLDGATGVSAPTLTWSGNGGIPAANSTVYFGTNLALVTAMDVSVRVLNNSPATSFVPTTLLNTTYYWMVVPSNTQGGPTSCPVLTFTTPLPGTFSATAQGGLWNSPATWVGGVVPAAGNDIEIPNGSTVIVNQALNYRDLTLNGNLQWATTNAATFTRNVTVSNTGNLFLSTPGLAGQTLNIGGDLTNNGSINAAATSAFVNFNGTASSEINGTGTFVGTGGRGIIRTLGAQNNGTFTLTNPQNITLTNQLINTSNNFVTNGRLRIDNAVDVFQSNVSQVVLTAMGSGYTTAPVVLGQAVSPWVASGTALINTRYFVGTNVYLCTVAGTFDVTAPVNTTPATEANGTATVIWVGNLGNLGNSFQTTAVTAGTQYYCGDNLYLCTVAGTPTSAAPPVHTSGTAASGTATFAYVGTVAKASLNWDVTTQTVRSMNLVSAGSGYQSIPACIISNTGAGTGATASSVVFQAAGPGNSIALKATASIFTGSADPRHSDAPAGAAGNGVYSATAATYGWYNSAVATGFSLPPLVNLVTAQGSGFTAAPTIVVSGGTVVTGTALTASAFQVNVAGGRIISLYCTTPGTTTYSVPPTITVTGGGGTGATFSWGTSVPTATVNLSNGTNGFITGINITNNGYGYVAAPTIAFRATVAGEVAALLPSCRLQQLNIQYSFFAPQTTNPNNNSIMALVPSNGRINAIGAGIGAQTFTSNIEITALVPLVATFGNVIDMGGSNNVRFSHPDYVGQTGTVGAFVTNGTVELSLRGGQGTATRTFPIGGGTGATAHFVHTTGLGASVSTGGYTYTAMRVSRFNTPSGTVSPGGNITGIRGVRADLIGTGVLTNLNSGRTVSMFWNILDNLVSDNASIFLVDATAPAGPWTVRSTAGVAGALATTGNRLSASAAPGPYANNATMYFAWANNGFTPPPALAYNVTRTTGNTYTSIASLAKGGNGTGVAFTGWSAFPTFPNDEEQTTLTLTSWSSNFQGAPITGIRVYTNGFIQILTATTPAAPSTSWDNGMARTDLPNVVAAFWDDLINKSAGGNNRDNSIIHSITGTSPNRVLTVEWANMTPFGADAAAQLAFQIQLFEATGEIRVNYGDNQMFNGTVERRYSYSVGIKGRYNTAYPTAGQVFAQQFENYNLFSPIRTQTPHLGANGMAVSPEPRSSFSFTPGVYTPPALPGTTPPDNDDFASYELISSLSVFPNNVAWNVPDNKSRLYSTRFATTSSPANCGTGPVNQKDVWFVFEANEVAVTSRIYPSGGYIARVEAFTTTGTFPGLSLGTSIACNVGPQGLVTDLNLTGLTIGNYYAVRVSHDRVGTAATFSATAVANGNLSGVSITGGGSNYTSATPTFNGPNGIRLKPTGGGGSTFVGEVTAITAGAVTGATFDGGNDYSSFPSIVVEQPDWGITGDFAIVIYAPPINDDCIGAIELTGIATSTCTPGANQLLGVSTASATPSTELSGPCNANDEDDLWYRFTATGTLTNVSVQGNAGFDPAIRFWSGADCPSKLAFGPPAGGCLNATGANGLEEVSLTTTPGTIYYIRVYDANPGSGPFGANFDICVTTPVPVCASNLVPPASATICGSSATTISWSAVPFATSYDVFFDAGTGPAITNVSPAQVGLTYNAGLLAAGDYTYRIVPKNVNGDAVGCTDVTFTVISPTPSSTTPATRCGTGTVTLAAAGSNLQWWSAPTGGLPIGTGTSFTTPTISATTDYYVSAGAISAGLGSVGTGTGTTSTSGVTPFTTFWEDLRVQYLIRASELTASGFSAGNMTSLAFDVTIANATTMNGFNIRMGHTSSSATVSGSQVTPSGAPVNVFSGTHTASVGSNNFTFSTPFNWNGTDNIYVEVCYDNATSDGNSTVRMTPTAFNSVVGWYDDGVTGCSIVFADFPVEAISVNRPNMVINGQTLCSGPRNLVTATVTPPPALTLDQSAITLCEGATEAINVTSTVGDFDSYVWSTPGEFSGTAGTGFTFNSTGASAGIRTLTATDGGSGCVNTATVNATVNPRPPVGTATATPNPVCEGTTLALDVTGFLPVSGPILTQNFESGIGTWTIAANSTNGTSPTLGNFRIVNHGITEDGNTYSSPGDTQFLLANSDAQGSGTPAPVTNTQLVSPSFSLVGYATASISFRHYYNGSTDGPAAVEVSTDGGVTFPNLVFDYSAGTDSDQGTRTNFASASFSLNAFTGQSNVRVRFRYEGSFDWQWAIDDISISGTPSASTYAWTSDLNGPIGSGRPFNYTVPQSEDGAFFTVRNTITATGCFREATTATAIDVTPRPDPIVLSLPDGTEYCGVPIEFTASSVGSDEITWGPVVGLTTDNIGTLPYPANFNLGTVYLSGPITATGTYVVTATSTVTGCFRTSNIDFTTCPPSSDFPCDADTKPLLPVNTLGGVTMSDANNLSAAATFLPGQGISAPSCFGTYNRDVWFRSRVPASGVLAINIQNNALTPMDLIADVFTSSNNLCSGTFTQVACNDQSGFGVNPWLQVTTLAPNQLIYIRVSRKGNGASPVGQFQIGISEGAVWSGAFNNNMLQQTDDVNGDNNWRFIDNTRLVDIANPVSIVIPNGVGATFPVLSTANFTVSNVFFRRITGSNSSSANLTVGTTRQLTLVRAGTSNTGNLSTNIFNGTGTFVNGPGIFNFGTLIPGPVNTYNMVGSAANSKNVTFTGVVAVRDNVTLNSNGNMIFANNSNLLSGNVNRGGVLARGNVVGNITYTRIGSNIPGVYNYWSSPITAAPISRLNNFGVGNNIYLYDNTRPGAAGNVLLGWEGPITATSTPTNTAATMIPGKGYIQTAAGTSAGVVTFTGAPQQSALTSIPVTRTSTNGFNLVGNPYPSYLDLSGTGAGTFFTTNTTVNGVYLWRNTSLPPYLGAGYVTMTSVGVSGSTTPGGFTAPQIGAAQGFMVDVSVATSLQFVGGMRGTGEPTNNPQFLDVNEFSTARVRIFNADESQSYETMLAFKDDATDEIDHQQDAVRFPVPLGLEVYTINGNNNFVIQALPTLHNGRIIPLGTQMGEANGSYKIRLTEFSNFESSTRVYIEDLATGAFHNLSQNNTYEFVNMAWTGERFKLHFRAPIAMAATGACAGDASGKLILNNPNPTAATLTVKNAEGMTIAQESNWMGDKVINNLSTGNYNVAIAYDANDVINMSASIANGSLTAPAAFTASSTVVTLEDASIQFAGNNNGATSYSWNFGDGNTVNGVLNPVHTYSAAGQYTVTFTTSSNGCESTTTKVINVSNGTVGINDIANGNSFSIYPNPSADIAYVMLNMAANEKDVMVTILDGAGRVVSKERVNEVRNGSVVTLNVSEIANGIYEVVVENKNFRAVGKLSVTH